MSRAIPDHVVGSPPRGSEASLWAVSGTGLDMFTLTAPIASIIDVDITFVLNDTGSAGSTYSVASGVVGVLYYLPLDGTSDAYVPVSLNWTT